MCLSSDLLSTKILNVTSSMFADTIAGPYTNYANMTPVTKLRDDTRAALLNRPRTLTFAMIADATGLTAHWLAAFAGGRIDNPGVVSVETLHTYLTNYKTV